MHSADRLLSQIHVTSMVTSVQRQTMPRSGFRQDRGLDSIGQFLSEVSRFPPHHMVDDARIEVTLFEGVLSACVDHVAA